MTAITFGAQIGAFQSSASTSHGTITATATAASTAGQRVVVVVRGSNATNYATGVVDSHGTVYTPDMPPVAAAPNVSAWGAVPAAGHEIAIGDTWTITMNANSGSGGAALVFTLNNVDPTTPVESTDAAAVSTAATSASVSVQGTSNLDMLIAMFAGATTGNPSLGSASSVGWSSIATANGDFQCGVAYFPSPPAGTAEVCQWKTTNSENLVVAGVTYRAAGSASVNAGTDQVVAPGQTVTLDGSGSLGVSTYNWTCTSGPDNTATRTGVHPTYTASLGTDVWQLQDPVSGLTDTVSIICTTNIRYVWDGVEIINVRRASLKSDGTVN